MATGTRTVLPQLTRRAPRQSVLTASDLRARHERRGPTTGLVLLALSLMVFCVLTHRPAIWDPSIIVPREHFLIVSAASLVAFAASPITKPAAHPVTALTG